MNQKFKIGLYLGLIIAAAIFGALFYSNYKGGNKEAAETNIPPINVSSELTNVTSQATNQTTNVSGLTNQPSIDADTNLANVAEKNPELATKGNLESTQIARPAAKGRSKMIGYFVAFLGIAIVLGLLIARDISEYFGSRSVEFMFNDEGAGAKDPEYEEAEQEWANGHHLEAIRLMRGYLTKNPREQGVALRIAEIYEKDLKNNLAAALEYEEILKHKLPPQRWGWAAIHLCNLYSKLHKTDQAVALLRRVVDEYGETPAAEKARKRLAMFETVGEEGLDGELPDSIQLPPPPPKPVEKSDPESNLPPGFRPKK